MRMGMRWIVLALAVLACAACSTPKRGSAPGRGNVWTGDSFSPTAQYSAETSTFIVQMVEARLTVIQEGKLVNERGSTPELRSYGARLMKDHRQMLSDLTQLASSSGLAIPKSISPANQARIKALADTGDEQFDQAFARTIRVDNERDIREFRKAAAFKDGDIARWAGRTVPVLEMQQTVIDRIASRKP